MDDNINEILSDYCIEAADSFVTGIVKESANITLHSFPVVKTTVAIFQNIHKTLDERTSHIAEQELSGSIYKPYKKILVEAAKICLSQGLSVIQCIDAHETAQKLAEEYFKQHSTEFGAEAEQLKEYLILILKHSIENLAKKHQQDASFQDNWMLWVKKSADHFQEVEKILFEEIDGLKDRMTNAESDISDLQDTVNQHDQVISGMQLPASIKEWRSYYQKIWNKPGFLDHDNPNAKKLGDYYKRPTCIGKTNSENTLDFLKACIFHSNCTQDRMLLVLGEPGVGKSTLISYLLNEKALSTKNRLVRVYRFCKFNASAWDTDPDNIPQQILIQTSLTEERLCHSVLILDGLDEINLQGNYAKFINSLYDTWADNDEIDDFSLIVTCRNTRISDYKELDCSYVVLNALENGQIEEFAIDYLGYCPENLKQCIDENEDLHEALGIPIILYMVLALDIAVSPNATMAEIYQEIFTPEKNSNSIYYRSYTEEHPIITEEMAQKIHEFSKQAAVKMWDLHPREAALTQEEWTGLAKNICKNSSKKDSTWENLLVGQYFVEGQKGHELCFVHRSMPEYFVALSFFDAIQKITSSGKTPEQLFEKFEKDEEFKCGEECTLTPFADVLGVCYLPKYPEIAQNLQYLLKKDFTKIGKDGDWWRQMIDCFCKYGLADAAIHRRHGGERGIREESIRFFNLLWIGRECLKLCGEKAPYQLIPDQCYTGFPLVYFQIPSYFHIDMQDIDLSYVHLENAYLNGAHLETTHLESAHLDRSQLSKAYLMGAYLREADLIEANLSGADLMRTHFKGAHLEKAKLEDAYLKEAHLEGAYLNEAYLKWAMLEKANMEYAHLEGAYLKEAMLEHANFKQTNLKHSNLTDTNLMWANLENAHLEEANLTRADLCRAQLKGAHLDGAILPNGQKYEDALKLYGPDVMLKFTDPDKWSELHPDKQVDPDRYR